MAPASRPAVRKAFWTGVLSGVMVAAFVAVAWSGWRKTHRRAIDPAISAAFLARNRTNMGVVQTASGLQYQVLRPGNGPRPSANDVAVVTYVGRLSDGTIFDSSTAPARLPVSDVVPGFAEALTLMPAGARYRIWMPPHLGYGARGAGPIPPGAVLQFDIALRDVTSGRTATYR